MVAGKLLVRARYPGTGSVRLLLVGRLMRRERSAARATTKTMRSVETARRETTEIFFTSGGLGRVLPSATERRQPAGGDRSRNSSYVSGVRAEPLHTAEPCPATRAQPWSGISLSGPPNPCSSTDRREL